MLVPVNDVERAAQALRLLANPELRSRMGRRSREIAVASISSERCAAAHVEAYRRALASGSCGSTPHSPAEGFSAT
jgi:glycosyltransferase involved in cell wall biosynthesis